MANLFTPGTLGRIKVAGNTIAGIKTWRLDQTTAPISIPNFESTTDANSRVWPSLLPGLSGATGSLEGYFDSDATNTTDGAITQIATGFQVTLDLYTDKDTSWGFTVTAFFTSFSVNANVENQPVTFTANFTVNGVVPLSAAI